MPWSARTLYAPAWPSLQASWAAHPTLGPALHHFPERSLPLCRLPQGGLLAIPHILEPDQCDFPRAVPNDTLQPSRPFSGVVLSKGPPSPMLAFLVEQSQNHQNVPLLFYECDMHGGSVEYEVGWLIIGKTIQKRTADPWVGAMKALGALIQATGWFAPHTSTFEWEHFRSQLPPCKPSQPSQPYQLSQLSQYSLFFAAKAQDWDNLAELLLRGHSPLHYRGRSPLYWASYFGYLPAAKILIEHGAVPTSQDLGVSSTAEVVQYLLEKGAMATPHSAYSLLSSGYLESFEKLESFVGSELVLDPSEAFLNACQGGLLLLMQRWHQQDPVVLYGKKFGLSALPLAASSSNPQAVQWLLEQNLQWDASALSEAAHHGKVDLVEQALDAGVSPDQHHWSNLPMARAAKAGHLEVLKLFYHRGVSPDQRDQFGRTALQQAALYECFPSVDWLIHRGADINATEPNGYTALWSAVGIASQTLADFLIHRGAKIEGVQCSGTSLETFAQQRKISLSGPKRILILGGTKFLGRALAARALECNHQLTLLHRGQHCPDIFPSAEHLIVDRSSREFDQVLQGREFDLVLDTSGQLPSQVRKSREILAHCGRYLYFSSVSAYDRSDGDLCRDEDAPLVEALGDLENPTPDNYAGRKTACEALVRSAFPGNHLILRPGLIAGPYDDTDRFSYWAVRCQQSSAAGQMLAPGAPSDPVQVIDVRDVAYFALHSQFCGVLNLVGSTTTGQLLAACAPIDQPVWVNWPFLEERQLRPWVDLPAWIPPQKAQGFYRFSNQRALSAGLLLRPLSETARDTAAWRLSCRDPLRCGLTLEREQQLLLEWKASQHQVPRVV